MLSRLRSSRVEAPAERERLEHVPEKLTDFSDKNMLQPIESAQFLIDRIDSIRSENALERDAGGKPCPLFLIPL
jgi:hypothetical protein